MTTELPLVSIIVPTRDRPALLRKALLSLASQTFTQFQVVIIDDASSEESRSAYTQIAELKDPRVQLCLLGQSGQKGIGPSAVRNHGIKVAQAEIIAFLDDDDFWTDDTHLARMLEAFQSSIEADAYISNQKAVHANGDTATKVWLPKLCAHYKTSGTVCVTHAELIHAQGFAHLNTYALKKSIAVEAGGFWERTNYEEDRDFYWRTIDLCKTIAFNPSIIGQHNIPDRSKQNNITTTFSLLDRWLVSILVSQHIACNVNSRQIATMTQRYEGDILRHLSNHFAKKKNYPLAFSFGFRALAARFSFKWLIYLHVLYVKALTLKN